MRKHGKRGSRHHSTITLVQHVDLMLAPRIHLEMVLAGDVNRAFQHSVLGVFNLAVALAYLQNKPEIQRRYEAEQMIMIELIQKSRRPTEIEAYSLCKAFNRADRHFGKQSKESMIQALELVDRVIAGGGNAVQGRSTG